MNDIDFLLVKTVKFTILNDRIEIAIKKIVDE